ncbi:MAG: Gfo/Idh/MocA family oxidoreductase, partial [Deltaproteobacteria bacterium]|nr:Gfo/Idh/MocA family oxidoreductase [Deltaproteobacteria bacterium]
MFKQIEGRKIRTAIIGCGRISKNHFESIKNHAENMELVAVCDNNKSLLANISAQYNVPGFTSFGELMEDVIPDIVSLCT